MDRPFYYSGEVPRTVDVLQGEQNTMVAISKVLEATLGTSGFVAGLACTPNSPAALNVLLSGGQVFQLTSLEATNYSSLLADTSDQIVKQGIALAQQTISITPPGTSGFSQVFMIEVQYADLDGGSTVLPYYNSANPAAPFSGPGNSGTAQNTKRTGAVSVQVKAGTAATTGTQVAPTVDAGWIALWLVTVANGATTITSGNIVQVANAPFLGASYMPKLPSLPAYIQSGAWGYVADTGAANAITVAPTPPLAALAAGNKITVKILNAVTGATTLAYTLSGGSVNTSPVVHGDGTALLANDLVASQVVELNFDGSNWQMPRASASVAANNLTASSVGFNAPINCNISATAPGGGVLTVTLLGAAGGAVSVANPIIATFSDATVGNGDPVTRIITSAPTFTVNSGNTLGGVNGQSMKLQVVLIDNAGTVLIGLQNCNGGGTGILGLVEDFLQSTGSGTGGGNSAGVIYTSVASLTGKAIRVIGTLEWTTPLTTAGTYANPPNRVRLFGPGSKKPGDVIGSASSLTASVSYTPQSPSSLIRVSAFGISQLSGGSNTITIKRASTTLFTENTQNSASTSAWLAGGVLYDQPNQSGSALAYTINSTGSLTTANMLVEEISV